MSSRIKPRTEASRIIQDHLQIRTNKIEQTSTQKPISNVSNSSNASFSEDLVRYLNSFDKSFQQLLSADLRLCIVYSEELKQPGLKRFASLEAKVEVCCEICEGLWKDFSLFASFNIFWSIFWSLLINIDHSYHHSPKIVFGCAAMFGVESPGTGLPELGAWRRSSS